MVKSAIRLESRSRSHPNLRADDLACDRIAGCGRYSR
jgi:hypothetical protein